ncbi:MAG: R3H domain-containing nucleic acid-binding protein [Blastocatellia bacterium]
MSEEKIAKNLTEFMNRIIVLSQLNLSVSVDTNPSSINLEFSGEDVSFLLGHNGELLNALEYLANKNYGRFLDEDTRIVFDSADFRNMREKELRLMAKHAAERVRLTKKSFTFEPMSPNERRIVHLALSEFPDLHTESQGEGDDRKVTIYLS